jgi:hypothetical protein
MIKFISRARVENGKPFLVRCNCDALLLAQRGGESIDCEFCHRTITPEVVEDAESVNCRDPDSGEWKTYHVQGYSGPRSHHNLQVGDIVGNGPGPERWRIESIDGVEAVVKLLGNDKKTGAPVELKYRQTVPLSLLRYTPD